jgi:hypothetical protein
MTPCQSQTWSATSSVCVSLHSSLRLQRAFVGSSLVKVLVGRGDVMVWIPWAMLHGGLKHLCNDDGEKRTGCVYVSWAIATPHLV